jgi:hypothetical protein
MEASSKPQSGTTPSLRILQQLTPRSDADGDVSHRASTAEVQDIWRVVESQTGNADSEDNTDTTEDWIQDGHGQVQPDNPGDVVKKAWMQFTHNSNNLLFCAPFPGIDLPSLHPNQVQIFRLFQIYLDNVNSLLRVTHAPTTQQRLLDAAADLTSCSPALHALMFSIYCTAVLSMDDADCQRVFKESQQQMLSKYHFACQQALLQANFLRTSTRDVVTAFLLYLTSIRLSTSDPPSVASMSAILVRSAQRMNIHIEAMNLKHPPLEAEMRRRLWWAVIIFDNRLCEMSDYRSTNLDPSWDCALPSNVNDSDLHSSSSSAPTPSDRPTEAVFAVVRAEIMQAYRHAAFHLNFTKPALKAVARESEYGLIGTEDAHAAITKLESSLSTRYLNHCTPKTNSLHYMLIHLTRASLARMRLLAHYASFASRPRDQTSNDRDRAAAYAIAVLEADTALRASSKLPDSQQHAKPNPTAPYTWLLHSLFPMPAYIHLLSDLRRRPLRPLADTAWDAMDKNYQACFFHYFPPSSPANSSSPAFSQDPSAASDQPATQGGLRDSNPFKTIFAHILVPAWRAREAACRKPDAPPVGDVPAVVRVMMDVGIDGSKPTGPNPGTTATSRTSTTTAAASQVPAQSAHYTSSSDTLTLPGTQQYRSSMPTHQQHGFPQTTLASFQAFNGGSGSADHAADGFDFTSMNIGMGMSMADFEADLLGWTPSDSNLNSDSINIMNANPAALDLSMGGMDFDGTQHPYS